MCDACSPAAHEPSSSPSVEIVQLSSRPGPPDDPWSFQRSRAPSPLEDEGRAAQQPDTLGAEPLRKALPPIFRRIDKPASPAKRDDFYPFKRLAAHPSEQAPVP